MCGVDGTSRICRCHRGDPGSRIGITLSSIRGDSAKIVPVSRTVVIVDDQKAFRLVARQILEADGFVIIGEAVDVASAIASTRELQPEIVLMDVRLPDGSGVDAARAIHAGTPTSAVVLTSTGDYEHTVRDCGAVGFISKSNLSAAALRALVDRR